MSDNDSLVETVCGKGIGDHLELLIERLQAEMGSYILVGSDGVPYSSRKACAGCAYTDTTRGECTMPYRADVYSTEKAALRELRDRMILGCESYEVREITPELLEGLRGWEVPGWWRPHKK